MYLKKANKNRKNLEKAATSNFPYGHSINWLAAKQEFCLMQSGSSCTKNTKKPECYKLESIINIVNGHIIH